MKVFNYTHWAIALMLTMVAVTGSAGTVAWRKAPINVDLVVGVEQMVILPQDGAVGLPPELTNRNVFRTLVTGGTAYWTALEPFEPKRIKVRLDSGEFILFDVTARVEKSPPAAMDAMARWPYRNPTTDRNKTIPISRTADKAAVGIRKSSGPDFPT